MVDVVPQVCVWIAAVALAVDRLAGAEAFSVTAAPRIGVVTVTAKHEGDAVGVIGAGGLTLLDGHCQAFPELMIVAAGGTATNHFLVRQGKVNQRSITWHEGVGAEGHARRPLRRSARLLLERWLGEITLGAALRTAVRFLSELVTAPPAGRW